MTREKVPKNLEISKNIVSDACTRCRELLLLRVRELVRKTANYCVSDLLLSRKRETTADEVQMDLHQELQHGAREFRSDCVLILSR